MQKDLPPLATLVAFEAAGRLQSFTRAAAELGLTQAAVSKQMRSLEAYLGVRLFDRSHRAVSLTAAGRAYLHTVVTALTHVAHATRELKPVATQQRLRIAADHSVAHLWLMPRLTALMDLDRTMTFHLVVSDAEATLLSNEVDMAILHGEGRWTTHESELLFPEIVFPVCSPTYQRALGVIDTPAELLRGRLIDLEDENWTWINWRIWLTHHGVGLPASQRSLTIGNYPLVLEAARRGHGVALAWQTLIESDLASGTLVRPIDQLVETRFGYYLAWPRSRPPSSAAAACRDWLRGEIAATASE
ncbi:MAG: LysR substrate-binding domain-containing protein [Hyphomicrobiaceae bacterium]